MDNPSEGPSEMTFGPTIGRKYEKSLGSTEGRKLLEHHNAKTNLGQSEVFCV